MKRCETKGADLARAVETPDVLSEGTRTNELQITGIAASKIREDTLSRAANTDTLQK